MHERRIAVPVAHLVLEYPAAHRQRACDPSLGIGNPYRYRVLSGGEEVASGTFHALDALFAALDLYDCLEYGLRTATATVIEIRGPSSDRLLARKWREPLYYTAPRARLNRFPTQSDTE